MRSIAHVPHVLDANVVCRRPGKTVDKALGTESKPSLFRTLAGHTSRYRNKTHWSAAGRNREAKNFPKQASSHVHPNTRLRADE
jgi:hypothetical protein